MQSTRTAPATEIYVVDIALAPGDVYRPIIFGVNADGHRVALHIQNFRAELIIEPPARTLASEDDADEWSVDLLKELSRPSDDGFRTEDDADMLANVNIVPDRRRKLFGFSEDLVWMTRTTLASRKALRRLRTLLKDGGLARVYHDTLQPELQFVASTGIRPYSWVRAEATRPQQRAFCAGTNLIEMIVDIKHLSIKRPDGTSFPPPPQLNMVAFDIETDGLDAEVHELRQIAVTKFRLPSDSNEAEQCSWLLTRHSIDELEPKAPDYQVITEKNEAALIERFAEIVQHCEASFLTGWNSAGFDLPFIWRRAEKLRVTPKLQGLSWASRHRLTGYKKALTSSAFGQNEVFVLSLMGITAVDGYILCRKSQKRQGYSLRAVAESYNMKKADVTYEEMVEAFKTQDPKLLREVADYCVQDARVAGRLMACMEEPMRLMAMSNLSGAPCSWLVNYGTQRTTWSLFVTESWAERICLNPRRPPFQAQKTAGEGDEDDAGVKYQGAIVLEPKTGYYHTVTITCDFSSLYPSIMRSNNLCPTTLIGEFCADSIEAAIYQREHEMERVMCIQLGDRVVVFSLAIVGIIPRILETLTLRRKEQRSIMAEALARGDKAEAARRDAAQLSLKISSNSIYGSLGSPTGPFGLGGVVIAEVVTGRGRQYLEAVIAHIPVLVRDGVLPPETKVIYGDTDSVMINAPGINVEQAEAVGKIVGERCTKLFPDPLGTRAMALEYEECHVRFLLEGKKRYAAVNSAGKMKVKGLSTQRRDYAAVVQEAIHAVLDQLLKRGGPDAPQRAVDGVCAIMDDVMQGRVPLERLAITKELNRAKYTKNTPPHQAVALRMAERDPEHAPKAGDRVTFVVLKSTVTGSGGSGASIADRCEDLSYVEKAGLQPDAWYYNDQIRNQVFKLLTLAGVGDLATSRFDRILRDTRLKVEGQMKLNFTRTISTSSDKTDEDAIGEKRPPTPQAEGAGAAKRVKVTRQTSLMSYFKK